MDSQYRFDLLQCASDPTAKLEQCWLMIDQITPLPEQQPFLFSLSEKHAQYKRLAAQGAATNLAQARAFFEAALAGECALSIFPMVLTHLTQVENLASAPAMACERATFAAQFDTQTPSQGLQGFLNKRAARFPVDAKSQRELRQVLQWLEHRC